MGEIASRAQLRMSFVRWALLSVPLIVFLGFFAGQLSNSGYSNAWFIALERPGWFPPGWLFGFAWTILYAMMGVALAMILDARGARGRQRALALFAAQLALNLAWSPLFFGAHQVTAALWLIVAMLIAAALTTRAFLAIRPVAGWLMLPYLGWLVFALALNFEMNRLNPDAEDLRPPASETQFAI